MLTPLVLLLVFLGQEIPPQTDNPPAQPARIVDSRPPLYLIRHAMHPMSWLDHSIRPVIRSAEGGFLKRFSTRRPHPPLKLGVDGMGGGSGFGPNVGLSSDDVFGHGIHVDLSALYTYSRYQTYQFNASVPLLTEGIVQRLSFDIGSAYRSRAADHFFGLGNDSRRREESHFGVVSREATAGFSAQLDEFWKAGLHAGYQNAGVRNPSIGESAQNVFRDNAIPGLLTGGAIRSASLSLEHNTKEDKRVPWHGGLQRIEAGVYDGVGKGDFAYWRYRVDLQQFFPLSRDHRKVIAVRGMVETNQEKSGSHVPFFNMPTIGDWDTIRGFENYRFRDKSAVTLGLEYRYRIWERFDWGLFLDRGQVAPELGDFALNRFHSAYGVRLIMLPKLNLPISFDIARSNEAWRFYINFSPSF